MYTMKLQSCGNSDFGEYAPVSEPETVQARALQELRTACKQYIEKWNLGGGNWVAPVVFQDGKAIGHFSYNSRLWIGKPRQWTPKTVEILI